MGSVLRPWTIRCARDGGLDSIRSEATLTVLLKTRRRNTGWPRDTPGAGRQQSQTDGFRFAAPALSGRNCFLNRRLASAKAQERD